MKGVLVTATGTEVGKTFVACQIARALKEKNIDVGVMKPVSSGNREDARLLKETSGSKDPLSLINPLHFKNPLAPYIASTLEKKSFSVKKVLACHQKIVQKHSFTIIEGIGGVAVPLSKKLAKEYFAKVAMSGDGKYQFAARLGTVLHYSTDFGATWNDPYSLNVFT